MNKQETFKALLGVIQIGWKPLKGRDTLSWVREGCKVIEGLWRFAGTQPDARQRVPTETKLSARVGPRCCEVACALEMFENFWCDTDAVAGARSRTFVDNSTKMQLISPHPGLHLAVLALIVLVVFSWCNPLTLNAQIASVQYGESVPASVKVINERALKFLVNNQSENGSWPGGDGYGSGVVGICVMAMMASGEDPDYGPYAESIRRSLRYIISNQNPITGVASGPGHGPMYHHGFATLALSEAYGVVNEDLLWKGSDAPAEGRKSIAKALELAVRCALTAQEKNPYKAWRYSPESQDADTTVSGTVLMGLLGARNAGVEIPNEAIEDALNYFKASTMRAGMVSYQLSQGSGESLTRSAIATLVYSIGKRKQTKEYLSVSSYIKNHMDQDVVRHPDYHRYYMAQALFQSDFEAWKVWNRRIIDQLQESQAEDGSFASSHGAAYGTGMAVLTLALNYRLLPVYER